jgi:hypothetical protein
MMSYRGTCVLAAVCGLGALPASAADISVSGFGTVGYAVSDQAYKYQRFVDDQGTFKRDSVVGAQIDAKLDGGFGLTLQGKVAPSMKSDKDEVGSIAWAFLSWRPTNDWLLRLGRVRVPLYLYSENMNVGTTFEFSQLPVEVYTTSQTTDGDGVDVSKTWSIGDNELTLLGYVVSAKTHYRFYQRDDLSAQSLPAGAHFVPVKMDMHGLVLTLLRADDMFRVGVHEGDVKITNGFVMPATYPYVSLMPGVGYYQTSDLLPGPGVPGKTTINTVVYAMGADMAVGNGFRLIGEYVRRRVPNIETGPDSQGGYLALLKPIGAWTPYVSVARLQSVSRTRDLYKKVNGNTVSGSALLNASQRVGADVIMAYDQATWALGTSYRLSPTSKLKVEWARTRTGDVSYLIDALPGGETGRKTLNVFSASYNVTF